MFTIKHHEFTLWIYDSKRNAEKVPAVIFEEGTSFDEICLMLQALDELGLVCSLTCDTCENKFVEENSND